MVFFGDIKVFMVVMKMKKIILILLFGLACIIALNAQSSERTIDLGNWSKELSFANKISISSYVTKYLNSNQMQQKSVNETPKYRYELVLQSNSIYNGRLVKTWIYGARVFIDSLEITREQSPDGFTAIIGTTPTVVYRYDSSMDTINIKISWKSSVYYRDR